MIFGERVKQARQLRTLTQTELAKRLSTSQSTIAHIENERLSPSRELLEAIAFQTGFPPSFFRQPPEEDMPLGSLIFRARASASSQAETTGYRYTQIGYRMIRSLLAKTKPIAVRLALLDDEDPSTAAKLTRSNLGLPPDRPIGTLVNALERAGVVIFSLPIPLPKIDAFSMWAEEGLPMIILANTSNQDGSRLRFSVAHEVAHLVLHRTLGGDFKEIESEANRFAGEFLLPEAAFREEVFPPVTLSALARQKVRWRVSLQALVMRAYELEIITQRQRKYLFQQLSAKGWRRREPRNLDAPVEHPQTLSHLAELHYGKPIDYRRLAAHTNLRSRFVEEFINAQHDINNVVQATEPATPNEDAPPRVFA